MVVRTDYGPSFVHAQRRGARRKLVSFLWTLFTVGAVLLWPTRGSADSRSCEGPEACCPAKIADDLEGHVEVAIGVTLLGLYNVNERAGTWDADFYLHETWPPAAGFTPQTEIVNEVSRQAQQFDTVELRRGRCSRSRRIHSTLHSPYNLRSFPFDHQRLTLQLSDAQFTAREATYAPRPILLELDEVARGRLSSWKVNGSLTYTRKTRIFKGDDGAPPYDYATVSLPVRRHVTFHLTKFFLPLLVIVVVAFSTFWIDPDDLSSRAGLGVTCLLAAIALQFAEAGSLPEVAYLTLADRTYAICYVALALATIESVYANAQARAGRKERGQMLDRRSRVAFPSVLALAMVLGVVRSVVQAAG